MRFFFLIILFITFVSTHGCVFAPTENLVPNKANNEYIFPLFFLDLGQEVMEDIQIRKSSFYLDTASFEQEIDISSFDIDRMTLFFEIDNGYPLDATAWVSLESDTDTIASYMFGPAQSAILNRGDFTLKQKVKNQNSPLLQSSSEKQLNDIGHIKVRLLLSNNKLPEDLIIANQKYTFNLKCTLKINASYDINLD